uniref:40S ribosomal protein S7 n=1 Tax=Kalanchoe fedtschenkoi TaxID=63787 RepID=A0A7N0UGZ7_KALFE
MKDIIIHVPIGLRKSYHKVYMWYRCYSCYYLKDHPNKGSAVQRPRNRTLTALFMKTPLKMKLYIRYQLDGSKTMKVFLDPKKRNNTKYNLKTFFAVYMKLPGKDVEFEYPVTEG